MENEAIADEILNALQQLLEAAGPEWTLQFLQAGIEEAGAGMDAEPAMMQGQPMMQGQAMMQGQEMPMQARRTVGRPR
jgi:hypothetical protein